MSKYWNNRYNDIRLYRRGAKNSEYVTSKLSDDLLRHIFLISLKNNLKAKRKYKLIKGKQIFMCEFIISASTLAIYKKFERKFGKL